MDRILQEMIIDKMEQTLSLFFFFWHCESCRILVPGTRDGTCVSCSGNTRVLTSGPTGSPQKELIII